MSELLKQADEIKANNKRIVDEMQPLKEKEHWMDNLQKCFEENTALIKALADELRGKWQDISTAPKDGYHVLLWRDDIQFVGYWAVAGWCMQGCKLIDPAPTKWQPLQNKPREE